MKNREAKRLLAEQLKPWRARSYTDLVSMIGREPITGQLLGGRDVQYQFEIEVFWDAKPGGAIRVMGMIDDGGWRAFLPLADDFIMAPDGSFIGEGSAT